MNTPEQIAAKWYPEGTIDHAVMRKRLAELIRRRENAAIERVARHMESNDTEASRLVANVIRIFKYAHDRRGTRRGKAKR